MEKLEELPLALSLLISKLQKKLFDLNSDADPNNDIKADLSENMADDFIIICDVLTSDKLWCQVTIKKIWTKYWTALQL